MGVPTRFDGLPAVLVQRHHNLHMGSRPGIPPEHVRLLGVRVGNVPSLRYIRDGVLLCAARGVALRYLLSHLVNDNSGAVSDCCNSDEKLPNGGEWY